MPPKPWCDCIGQLHQRDSYNAHPRIDHAKRPQPFQIPPRNTVVQRGHRRPSRSFTPAACLNSWLIWPARQMPDRQAQRKNPQRVTQQRRVPGVNLPAPPKRNTRGHQHQHASKMIHAPIPLHLLAGLLVGLLVARAVPLILPRTPPRLTPPAAPPYREKGRAALSKGSPPCLKPSRPSP